MTLGCGGWGGNITSDNISPRHLLNIKRLAYETQPAKGSVASDGTSAPAAPDAPVKPAGRVRSAGLKPELLSERIDLFLASRGIAIPETAARNPGPDQGPREPERGPAGRAAEFVCEEDVRQALKSGVKIVLDSRTIVTPAARDLGEEKRVFVDAR
jgi:hypothetical protein